MDIMTALSTFFAKSIFALFIFTLSCLFEGGTDEGRFRGIVRLIISYVFVDIIFLAA